MFCRQQKRMGTGERAEYMDRLNRMETSTIFKARLRMLEAKTTIRMNTETECAD